jgi:hypothetical protein
VIEPAGSAGRDRVLDPVDRNSELLFGLFMVLSFTGTLSVATAGREDVRTMLIAAIGCNAAWGFVDGMMYVLRNLVGRGRDAAFVRSVRDAADPARGRALVAGELGRLAPALDDAALERVRQWLQALAPSLPERPRLQRRDLLGALAVFLLVFLSTFPVVLPFVFIADLRTAMRVSGAIALAMLFVCGWNWGHYAGSSPLRAGTTMMLLGVAIEGVVIALGG